MNPAEREAYLREYEVLKKKGKPFFPYAVAKDSAMLFIVAVGSVTPLVVFSAGWSSSKRCLRFQA